MPIYHFEVMRRRPGPARDLVSQLRLYSKQFMAHVETSDSEMMVEVSKKAWETMVSLFNFLRNEQDAGRLSATYMSTETAILAKKLNIAERDAMLQNKKLDRRHQNFSAISLREALNKIAHHDPAHSTYRIARRAHYLILSGPDQNPRNGPWLAEIHITKLCNSCDIAIRSVQN